MRRWGFWFSSRNGNGVDYPFWFLCRPTGVGAAQVGGFDLAATLCRSFAGSGVFALGCNTLAVCLLVAWWRTASEARPWPALVVFALPCHTAHV